MAAVLRYFLIIGMRANIIRHAFKKTQSLLEARLSKITQPLQQELQPILVRSAPRQPISRAALLRQNKGRWYTTHSTINSSIRRFMSTGGHKAASHNRALLPSSATATAVSRLTTRAPFSSTLRPNLTGGALPRFAGGYSLGGAGGRTGVRHFSHTPAAQAQVVNNVSIAVRAFFLSGQKVQYDGQTSLGEKRYRAVTKLQKGTGRKMSSIPRQTPGSHIDFQVSPTITALTTLGGVFANNSSAIAVAPHLNTEGFLDVLSVDFARALKEFAATMNDLKRLATLGDLAITLEENNILRVKFPGCDADTIERLCEEVGVERGLIYQDEDFDKGVGGTLALTFPFAPASEHTLSSPGRSLRSQTGHDFEDVEDIIQQNPWLEGYESMDDFSDGESVYFSKPGEAQTSSSEYEGLEGIYRFIEQCDNARPIH
jgi:hypothetical protein